MRLYKTLQPYLLSLDNLSFNGVYKIYHISKPEVLYIGSTFRQPLKKVCKNGFYGRWIEHYNSLKKKTHYNTYLQNVINKYGLSGLRFEIIEIVNNIEEVRLKELYYINQLNTIQIGYNTSTDTEHPTMTIEHRLQLSNRMKLNNPMKNKDTAKKVGKLISDINSIGLLAYDKNGTFKYKFKNSFIAGQELQTDSSNINRAANGITKSSANLIWIIEVDFSEKLLKQKLDKLKIKKSRSIESREKSALKVRKPIQSFDLQANLLKDFNSIKEASEFYNIDPGNLSNCLNGKYKTCKGMKFKFRQ